MPVIQCEQTADGAFAAPHPLVDILLAIVRAHGAPDELARNLAQVDPEDLDYAVILEMVQRRIVHFGVRIPDPHALTRALWRAAC